MRSSSSGLLVRQAHDAAERTKIAKSKIANGPVWGPDQGPASGSWLVAGTRAPGCWDARATASGPDRPSSAAQVSRNGQIGFWARSAARLPAVWAMTMAVVAWLRSRVRPGSQDTSQPSAVAVAVWGVSGLLMWVLVILMPPTVTPPRARLRPAPGAGAG